VTGQSLDLGTVAGGANAGAELARRRWGAAALVLAAMVTALWLLDVAWRGRGGWGVSEALSRVAIVAALAAGAGWLAAALAARVAGRRGWQLAAALALPGLVVLSLAVRFAGIDSEVSGRYYLDEGTYYHHATAIDGGELLTRTFVYPHLTYYADALTLWVAARFQAVVGALARRLYGLDEPLAVAWLLLRGVVALLSALTVVPVWKIAERLSRGAGAGDAGLARAPWTGPVAGALAAGLLIFSDLFNQGSHLNTCDVPSAFFATVCLLFAARLAERESARDYALAGVAAGLAAASKYPAGLAALAVAAVWAGWRLRRRDWNPGLAWAALAAAGTVVAVMPSLVAYPDLAFGGERGVFFGARQYGRGGWLGVMPDSNAAFYGGELLSTFGWPAVAAGVSGLGLLAVRSLRAGRAARQIRGAGDVQAVGDVGDVGHAPVGPIGGDGSASRGERRSAPGLAGLLWLAVYPAAFLGLIASMNMVVKRNLYPVLPILAVYLGVGMAAWLSLVAELASRSRLAPAWRWGRWVAAVLALACLWPPVELTARQTIGYVSPTTREEAAAWIGQHLPPGASIVKESYTPDFPAGRFAVSQQRLAGRIPIPELRDPQNDYLLLSSAAYARFRDPAALFTDNQRELARRYDEIFRTFPLVKEWLPGELQLGPVLRLYRIDPDPAACVPRAELPAADAFVPDESMRPAADRPDRPLRYDAKGQWSLFRACLPAGRYRLALVGEVRPPALVRVADATGSQLDQLEVKPAGGPGPAGVSDFELARPGKVLLYVDLGSGSRLRAVNVARLSAAPALQKE
jgi:4-amino-4-deoxy-L-arabinose transferase-like glycosyltransferase